MKENLCVIEGGRPGVPMDDRELARAARDGDDDAFAALVRRHSGGLHRAVARMLFDDEEAWDVVQMAWVRAWERLDRYDSRWSFATWVYRIATNLAIDVIRARSSRDKAHQAGMEHRLRLVGESEPSSRSAAANEVDDILEELVEELTPQQRSAFVLREIEGHDTADVARMLGCSATTVRNHIFQARKVLRREMSERFPEYLPASLRG
jgi:RNA polymerase sigma-70 factor (ECF subfamily)